MIDLQALWDFTENDTIEFKAAQGTRGKGAIPQSLWETYSAMANTNGGTIYLGIRETDEGPVVEGIKSVDQIQKFFWNSVNNTQVISTNLLKSDDVTVVQIDGKNVLSIEIPKAKREDKPVHVKNNPFTGTYRRNYEGDYKCDKAAVQRMIAEAQEPARDSRLLANYTMDDLDGESLRLFRRLFTNTNSSHPFLTGSDQEMLRQLGGWRLDRDSKETGLTAAGLLMFGKLTSILEVFSDYKLDYRELPSLQEEQAQEKWLDRIHTDGSWSGNLFTFYRNVYDRLVEDLKVPFNVDKKGQRIDETPVHRALREALVNALIHADFSARPAILITKQAGEFRFTNPGNLRLPVQIVVEGGQSDCRNPSLQKMFQMIGAAEQAGSGIRKIWIAWQAQHWRIPLITDSNEPEFTRLILPTVSLLPEAEVEILHAQFGEKFDLLSEAEKLAVVTAQVEGTISNSRLRELIDMHRTDCSTVFKGLVENGFLEPERAGRWTKYHINHADDSTTQIPELEPQIPESNVQIPELKPQIPEPTTQIPELEPQIPEFNSDNLENNRASILKLDNHAYGLTEEEAQKLMELSSEVRSSKKVSRQTVYSTIIQLCENEYRTPKLLEELLGRTAVRRNYLTAMVTKGDLERKYPNVLNSPDQAYRATERAKATLHRTDLSLFPDQNLL